MFVGGRGWLYYYYVIIKVRTEKSYWKNHNNRRDEFWMTITVRMKRRFFSIEMIFDFSPRHYRSLTRRDETLILSPLVMYSRQTEWPSWQTLTRIAWKSVAAADALGRGDGRFLKTPRDEFIMLYEIVVHETTTIDYIMCLMLLHVLLKTRRGRYTFDFLTVVREGSTVAPEGFGSVLHVILPAYEATPRRRRRVSLCNEYTRCCARRGANAWERDTGSPEHADRAHTSTRVYLCIYYICTRIIYYYTVYTSTYTRRGACERVCIFIIIIMTNAAVSNRWDLTVCAWGGFYFLHNARARARIYA